MNPKEALQEIKKLLFAENGKQGFALVEAKLEDGTLVKYDLATADIFVVGQDGADVPAPVGEHKLETGEILVVTEAGKIAEVKEVETPAGETGEGEVKAGEDVPPTEDAKPKIEEQMSAMEEKYAALEKQVAEMSKKLEEMGNKNEKMSAAVKLSAEVLEQLSKEPSDEPIQKPNTFFKQHKNEKEEKFNKLQQVFQNLKTK